MRVVRLGRYPSLRVQRPAGIGPHVGVAVLERDSQRITGGGFAGPPGQAEYRRLAHIEMRVGNRPRQP